ncbi:MAG: hypothetical protein Kow00109_21780 [Acidobacteriota bacterium]
MAGNLYTLRRQIVEVGRRVYQRNFVAANDGNISARIDRRRVLITPSGVSKGFMRPEDLIVVDYDGNIVEGRGKPSSETFMHLAIYREREDVNGVVHAHPPKATGFATAGIPLTQCVLPEVIVTLGGVPLAEYGTPGTEELYEPVLKYLKDYDAFLLENHGALAIGPDVMTAYYRMETLEHFAHIALVALQLGRLQTLGREHVAKLLALRERFGIRTRAGCDECERERAGACPVEAAQPPSGNGRTARPGRAAPAAGGDLVEAVTREVLRRLAGAGGERA